MRRALGILVRDSIPLNINSEHCNPRVGGHLHSNRVCIGVYDNMNFELSRVLDYRSDSDVRLHRLQFHLLLHPDKSFEATYNTYISS